MLISPTLLREKSNAAMLAGICAKYLDWLVGKVCDASRLDHALVMLRSMRCSISEHKVFRAIIGFNLIDVMNYFATNKRSSKFDGHDENVLPYIPSSIRVWMARHLDESIPMRHHNSAFPVWVSGSSPRSFWSSHSGNVAKELNYGY